MDEKIRAGFKALGLKSTASTSYEDIEKWLLEKHLICLKPIIRGDKRLKFECHPWLIGKHEGKVICYQLCEYTGKHKTVFGAYVAGLEGAIKYLNLC
jgi:hypothetical protein